ncbi:hypothetical protein CCR75_008923 [Bremia lactucae]|uniref:Uncharacterized protein n=1 Tax=Bremia lactucae TaxID=4779 RepID=A0A976IKZ4_BRELC|nr:hypothetical protein CCR75_008923 [Bremia lactucae]
MTAKAVNSSHFKLDMKGQAANITEEKNGGSAQDRKSPVTRNGTPVLSEPEPQENHSGLTAPMQSGSRSWARKGALQVTLKGTKIIFGVLQR